MYKTNLHGFAKGLNVNQPKTKCIKLDNISNSVLEKYEFSCHSKAK